MIKVEKLSYEIEEVKILEDISLGVWKNKFVGIIGANGCGKSTLLKNIYGVLKNQKGVVKIENIDKKDYTPKELAKKIAVLSQKQGLNFDFTVREIVEMGRYAHQKSVFERRKEKIIDKAIEKVGLSHLENRSLLSLSGGEIQRVFIARAIAQDSEIFILDEPTNHLDIKYQLEIMKIIKEMGKTVLAVIHDMNIASMYCDYVYGMKKGKIIEKGEVKEIFTKERIKNIFDVECEVIPHPINRRPVIIF